jgi:multidrug efflux system membrane fusion protein
LRPVRYQEVYATGAERVRRFSGTAQAGMESHLSFKVGGTVERVAVKVGDRVRPGQLLAQLDPHDLQLQVQETEASLERARAEARNTDANYNRVRELYENRNSPRRDLDAARAQFESARANVQSLEKRLELARTQLGYARLSAPVEGAIASVKVEVNENVSPGQVILELTSGERPEVEVAIPEMLIAELREGDPARVTFDAIPDREFGARITEVGVASSGYAATYPVTVLLDRPDDALRPGMAADVAFTFGVKDARERFLVPPFAVSEDRQGRFLYTVEESEPGVGVTHRRPVEVGELTADGLEILSGLSDGDRVVTAGVSRIHDGMRVKLPGSAG